MIARDAAAKRPSISLFNLVSFKIPVFMIFSFS